MSKENEQTIEIYEKFGDKYLNRNAENLKDNPKAKADNDRHIQQLKKYLRGLPKDAKIFEIGSADGRDAKFFQSFGYENITVSDATNYFLKLLKEKGFSPIKFNLITDDFPKKYDFIYCWAVLVHFTKDEAKQAIKKMFDALNANSRIALCVQYDNSCTEAWLDKNGKIGAKRYFSYWTKDELQKCLEQAGFNNITIDAQESTRSCWLECYAEKH